MKNSPSVQSVLPAALILAGIGWLGLAYVIWNTLPTAGPRWLFFFMGVLAITGTALPFVAFLNLRFPSQPPASQGVVLRQALWVSVFVATMAWLQMGRVLTTPLILLVGLGLILVEWLLRLRERSQWKP